jgi:hypothetical protein
VPDLKDIFENIYILIPVALVIFVRVFADALRKRYQQGDSIHHNPEVGKRKVRTVTVFSRLRERFAGLSSRAHATGEPLDYEVSELPRFERPAPRLQTHSPTPRTVGEPDTPGPRAYVTLAGLKAQRGGQSSAQPVHFNMVVDRLPPLQKAFTMTVILGKPKSLEE